MVLNFHMSSQSHRFWVV